MRLSGFTLPRLSVFQITEALSPSEEEGGASLRDGLRSEREALGQPVVE